MLYIKYKTDDVPQITYTHSSTPRGCGYDILHKHSDGFMPCRNGTVLLGIRHSPVDVSDPTMARLNA